MLEGDIRFECFQEFVFYGDSVTDDDLATLERYVAQFPVTEYHGEYWNQRSKSFEHDVVTTRIAEDGIPIAVRSVGNFVRFEFMPWLVRARALVVAFNAPFDLSRLAIGSGGDSRDEKASRRAGQASRTRTSLGRIRRRLQPGDRASEEVGR